MDSLQQCGTNVSFRHPVPRRILTQYSFYSSVAASFGHLPLTPFHKAVAQICQVEGAIGLPDDLRHQSIIQSFCDRVTKLMSETMLEHQSLSGVRSSIATLESEWHAMEQNIGTKLSGEWFSHTLSFFCSKQQMLSCSAVNQVYLHCARLYLRIYYFFDVTPETVLKAYETAEALVSSVTAADSSWDLLLYAPSYIFRMMFNAATVHWKVLQSSYADLVDADVGRQRLSSTILALRKCSVKNNDIAGRQSEILTQMWLIPKRPNDAPSLYSRGRFGASLTYDVLCQWRDQFGEKSDGVYTSPTGKFCTTTGSYHRTWTLLTSFEVPLNPGTRSGSRTPSAAAGQMILDSETFTNPTVNEYFNELDFLTFDFDMPSISSLSPRLSNDPTSTSQLI